MSYAVMTVNGGAIVKTKWHFFLLLRNTDKEMMPLGQLP